ncbi:hypothetical protein KC966_18315, partial [Proteus terrae]|uniref:hypothetical protein n=1 Tax=Proteus terrae TaxID=1574161 RepID=UPI00331548A7
AQKCGGQTLRLTGGFAPKTKNVHWGSLAIAGACHFVSAPPVLLGWSNRFLPQNKFVSFSDFASFYLSVCMMLKTHSEARKTV